jgi:hypothetical protein
MQPLYCFSDADRQTLLSVLQRVKSNPYTEFVEFQRDVRRVIEAGEIPVGFADTCLLIKQQRDRGVSNVHVLRNCPIDPDVPQLDPADPVKDKYRKKQTFIGEALLAVFSEFTGNPLLAYGSRNNGDFFTDVIAINRYSGKLTGFSDSELVYHNDRTAHEVRADFISLLGMRCPETELIFTGFVDGRDLMSHLPTDMQAILRKPHFVTQFDVYSRDTNERQVASNRHPILEYDHTFRYLDTMTGVEDGAPTEAKDALIAMKNALTLAPRTRHRILTGDLLAFANQDGLHNREKVEIQDPDRARSRWLLKTYAFRDHDTANRHAHRWLEGQYGRVAD